MVADEIGKLAIRTGGSTEEIRLLISQIQERINITNEKVDNSKNLIDLTSQVLSHTKKSNEINIESIESSLKAIENLEIEIKDVNQDKDRMLEEVREISDLAGQTKKRTQDITRAMDSQTENIDKVSDMTGELREFADLLNQEVIKFKI